MKIVFEEDWSDLFNWGVISHFRIEETSVFQFGTEMHFNYMILGVGFRISWSV